jgi:hypothetical protein
MKTSLPYQHSVDTLALIADCNRHRLSEWECRFVGSVVRQARPPSDLGDGEMSA